MVFIMFIFLLALVSYAIFSAVQIIAQDEVMVIERLGRYQRTLQPGLNFIIPFVDAPKKFEWKPGTRKEVLTRIPLRETVYDFPKEQFITKDNMLVEIQVLVHLQVTDAIKTVYEASSLPDSVEKLIRATLRYITGGIELKDLRHSRGLITKNLDSELTHAADKWGVKINRVEISDIKNRD